jgi:hypothetical protein
MQKRIGRDEEAELPREGFKGRLIAAQPMSCSLPHLSWDNAFNKEMASGIFD